MTKAIITHHCSLSLRHTHAWGYTHPALTLHLHTFQWLPSTWGGRDQNLPLTHTRPSWSGHWTSLQTLAQLHISSGPVQPLTLKKQKNTGHRKHFITYFPPLRCFMKNSPYYLLDKNNLIWVHKWASLIAQLVKNSPAVQEIPVGFLGREVPLERKSYPLQYSWASLVAQLVKNPPAMRETYTKNWSLRSNFSFLPMTWAFAHGSSESPEQQ